MSRLLKKYKWDILGTLVGVVGGVLYWHFFGCTDSCPIRSNPYLMGFTGALFGYSVTGIITDFLTKK